MKPSRLEGHGERAGEGEQRDGVERQAQGPVGEVSLRRGDDGSDGDGQEQKGGHYPTVDLIVSNQRSDVGFDNQQSPQRDTQYIGVDIRVPIYSGGSTSAKVREAWAQYYIAREEEEAVRREVLKRTREAWLNTRSSRKRIDSANLSVESAAKSYEAMNKSFSYGTVTATDVDDTQTSRQAQPTRDALAPQPDLCRSDSRSRCHCGGLRNPGRLTWTQLQGHPAPVPVA